MKHMVRKVVAQMTSLQPKQPNSQHPQGHDRCCKHCCQASLIFPCENSKWRQTPLRKSQSPNNSSSMYTCIMTVQQSGLEWSMLSTRNKANELATCVLFHIFARRRWAYEDYKLPVFKYFNNFIYFFRGMFILGPGMGFFMPNTTCLGHYKSPCLVP